MPSSKPSCSNIAERQSPLIPKIHRAPAAVKAHDRPFPSVVSAKRSSDAQNSTAPLSIITVRLGTFPIDGGGGSGMEGEVTVDGGDGGC